MFIQLYNKGLAYRKRGFVNWCPEDKTVLANEQVKDGKCERCGTEIVKKDQNQWYFKITDYADRLVDDLDKLPDWPENLKTMQREWIGRSYGAEINFTIEDSGDKIAVYTTRPDTIFGVTFMAIAPEAEILETLNLEGDYKTKVEEYKKKAMTRSDIERSSATDEKDGVFTGKYAINPYNGEKVELWVADYVLAGYGTGVVMAVPAHDTRDFSFANKYNIPIKVVIHPDKDSSLDSKTMTDAYTDYGVMVNSDNFDGLSGKDAIKAVTDFAEKEGFGCHKVNFKLKDWSISRQRYWGCPIPIIHCKSCGTVPIPEEQLPVELPKVKDFKPKGRSPLADVQEYMQVKCPKCGGEAERDSDTMDTFVCSSWYFLRYLDPHNDSIPFDKEKAAQYMPIDLYVGGITHATGHLIYFRFFQKFLKDLGWVQDDEPAKRMFNHGMVCDSNGDVMSKSKGNVVSPIGLMQDRGVDVSRLAMFFTAPSDKEVLWSSDALTGVEKFAVNKLYPLHEMLRDSSPDLKCYFKRVDLSDFEYALYIKLNQVIKQVADSFERLQFNTAISGLMELVREYNSEKIKNDSFNDYLILKTYQLSAPLVPHLAEEVWKLSGFRKSIFKSGWPVCDESAIVKDTVVIGVQINGKLRDEIEIPADCDQKTAEEIAFKSEKVLKHTDGKNIVKIIFVKGRIFNIVVKG